MTYKIEVETGNLSGADTEAPISINIIGERGDSGERRLYLSQTEGKMFSQGKVEIYLFRH